ncbi:MAG TPA: MFS transporter [Marmoricola sp.]|nr:MFS transporter [Marmoricola sp.]
MPEAAPVVAAFPEASGTAAASVRVRSGALVAVVVVVLGLNLRTVFSSLAAVLPEATGHSDIPSGLVTVLSTVPVLLLGVCAPLAPPLARRLGLERSLLAVAVLLTAGLLVRGDGLPVPMLVGTAACGAAIAIGNVLLPALVKRDFPHRAGLMSGVCTASMCASAALAAALTHPVYDATGSWRLALLVWALPALLAALLVLPLVRWTVVPARSRARSLPSLWRSATARHATTFMVLQAMSSFSVFGWLAPILRSRGIDGGTAGLLAAGCILVQVVGCLAAPALAGRCRDQRLFNAGAALLTGGSFVLCIVGPVSLVGLWVVLLGLGQGSLTALALALIVFRTRDSGTAARLSGMMQGVGYGVGSSGTLLVGLVHTSTGSFGGAAILFATTGALGAVFGYLAGRSRPVG